MSEIAMDKHAYLNPPGWNSRQSPPTKWTWGNKILWQIEELPHRPKDMIELVKKAIRKPEKKQTRR